ncbi:reverse transcriptase domain-containing protein [Tanacetum coccineum]
MLNFPISPPEGPPSLSSRLYWIAGSAGQAKASPDVIQEAAEIIKVDIHLEYTEQTIAIGSTLTEEGRKALCDLLRQNLDVFAWKPTDITGVPRHIAEHRQMCVKDAYQALNNKGHGRDIQNPEGNKHEVKPKEMHLRNRGRHVPGIQTEAAVKETKKLIVELPTLTAPMEKEELIVYLTAVREAVRAVLMTKREAKQMPVYFVSRALQDLEINYTSMKKLVLALVYASKWLKRYFQAHIIIIITDQLIKQILSRPEVTRRLQKWSIKLGKYDIQYRPRTLVKGQILVDFIVECLEDDPVDRPIKTEEE